MTKLEASIPLLGSAIQRLEEVLNVPRTDIARDSAVKRFELCMDLSWKTVKAFLEEKHGVTCSSPKSCFRAAFSQGLLGYEAAWLELVDLRNEAAHIYHVSVAEKVFAKLPQALQALKGLLERIQAER